MLLGKGPSIKDISSKGEGGGQKWLISLLKRQLRGREGVRKFK
jgi:hypothetical protein